MNTGPHWAIGIVQDFGRYGSQDESAVAANSAGRHHDEVYILRATHGQNLFSRVVGLLYDPPNAKISELIALKHSKPCFRGCNRFREAVVPRRFQYVEQHKLGFETTGHSLDKA